MADEKARAYAFNTIRYSDGKPDKDGNVTVVTYEAGDEIKQGDMPVEVLQRLVKKGTIVNYSRPEYDRARADMARREAETAANVAMNVGLSSSDPGSDHAQVDVAEEVSR